MSARVTLRPPVAGDMREFVSAARKSRALHRPWVFAPERPAAFQAYLRRRAAAGNCAFLVCLRTTGAIAGVVNVSEIVRGPLRSAYLGYYAFAGYERRGLMREGLQLVVRHAFKVLELHRVEANIQPGNKASIALAKSCGFSKEGYSPRYLKIGGRWRDHERWARVKL